MNSLLEVSRRQRVELATLLIAGSDAPAKVRRTADVKCSGTRDDLAIRTKIAALQAAGITTDICFVFMGSFDFWAPVDCGGFNRSVLEMRGGSLRNEHGSESAVTVNIAAPDVTISVTDASLDGFAAGHMVWIYDDNEDGDNSKLRTIVSRDTVANTITVDSAVGQAFTVAANAKVVNAFPLFRFTSATSNGETRGFNIDRHKATLVPSTAKYPIPLLSFVNCTDWQVHHSHLYESRVVGVVLVNNVQEHDNTYRDFANAEEVVHFTVSNGASAKNSKYTDCDMTLGSTRICMANYRPEISGNDYKGCRKAVYLGAEPVNDDVQVHDNNYQVDPAVITDGKFAYAAQCRVNVQRNTIIGAEYPVDIPLATAGSICKNNNEINCTYLSTEKVSGSVLALGEAAKRKLAYQQIMQILGSTLVGFWPGENISGTQALDISGNNYNMDANPDDIEDFDTPPSMLGLFKGQTFNGTDEYLNGGDQAAFSFVGTPFSYAFVFVPSSVTGDRMLFGKYNIVNQREWASYIAGSKLYAINFQESNDSSIGRYYNTVLTAGSNYCVVITHDGGALSAGIKIYLNKVRIDDTDFNDGVYAAMEDTTGPLHFGSWQNGAAQYGLFEGQRGPIILDGTEWNQAKVNAVSDILMAMAGI